MTPHQKFENITTVSVLDAVVTIVSSIAGTALLGLLAVLASAALFVAACFALSVVTVGFIAGVAALAG